MNRTLAGFSRVGILALALAVVTLIGAVDYLVGVEISLSVFHLAPVSLAAWYGAKRDGLVVAITAGLVWSADDLILGYAHGHAGILIWDTVIHVVFLGFSSVLLTVLRDRLADEQQRARRDPLTGVLNLRAFQERIDYSLALSARDGQPLTLAYVDLDDFKRINDVHGHTGGDLVLATIGGVLAEAVRNTDTVARVGGDEFALLFPGTGSAGAADVISKLRQRLAERLTAAGLQATCSIGAVTYLHPPQGAAQALAAADRLMYQVKRSGKNAIAFGVFDGATAPASPVELS